MTATPCTVARVLTALLVAWLALRGAVSVWQAFDSSEASSPLSAAPSATPLRPGAPPHTAPPVTQDAAAVPPQSTPVTSLVAVPWRALESSASFVEGHAGPTVVAFIDLDCSFCSQLWRRVRAPVAAGRIRVRWIPVAVVQPAAAWRAAALLLAADPVAALAAHESRNRAALNASSNDRAPGDDIAANHALLAALTHGRPATPMLVWRASDLTLRVFTGLPPDLAAVLDSAH